MNPTRKELVLQWGAGTEDGRLTAQFPFDPEVKDALKSAVCAGGHWENCRWRDPVWSIAPQYADEARTILTDWAAQRGWPVFDHTTQDATALAASREQADQDALAAHEAAFGAVLPDLPAHTLALVGWGMHGETPIMHLEVRRYLDDPALYKRLMQAALDTWQRPIIASLLPKRTGAPQITVAGTPTILRALLDATVEYAVLQRDLTVAATFEDGVGQFAVPSGALWLGARYDQVRLAEYESGRDPWRFAVDGDTIYCVEPAASQVQALLTEDSRFVGFGGPFAVAVDSRSQVVAWFEQFHALDWLRDWCRERLAAQTVTPRYPLHDRHRTNGYRHPADRLLAHIERTRAADLLRVIGYDAPTLVASAAGIQGLKHAAATAFVAERRAHALTLAEPLLNARTKAELIALAERWGIAVKRTARKAELVAALLRQDVAEAVIGLCAVEA